jgi:Spy/CpxP family protein refolding chaperone
MKKTTMHHSPKTDSNPSFRRKWLRPMAFAFLASIAGAAAAVGMHASGGGMGGWHHGGGDLAALTNPAERAAHVDKMLQHVYVEVGATEEQKRRLGPIVKQATDQLIPHFQEMHDGHAVAHELLGKDRVDPLALEAARQEHMRLMDQSSRILVKLVADVSDVLTPAQRKILLARIQQHHGGRHG